MYICEICGAEFEKKKELKEHLQLHENSTILATVSDEKLADAPVSNEVKAADVAVKTVNVDNGQFICKYCRKTFTNRKDLTKHIAVFHYSTEI